MSLAAVPDPDSDDIEPISEFEGLPIIGATLSFPFRMRHTAPPIRIYDRHNNRTQIVEPTQ